MKLIFMGTPDFAVPAIDALIAAGHDIAAVFSQPDKPKGRGYTLTPPPVKVRALAHGIPVWQPASMRDGEALKIFEEIQPDVAVVIAYGRILPKEILDTPKYGCINVHASLLPRYRGAAPIQWSVIDGEAVTGVTTQQMDVGLDTGDILMTSETPIGPDETAGELHDRLSEMSAKLIVDTLAALEKGELHPQKQDDAQSCYARMLTKELCAVDWTKDARRWEKWALAHYLSPAFGGGALNLVYHVRGNFMYPRGQDGFDGWSLLWYEAWASDRRTATALWRRVRDGLDWSRLDGCGDGTGVIGCCDPRPVSASVASVFLAAAARACSDAETAERLERAVDAKHLRRAGGLYFLDLNREWRIGATAMRIISLAEANGSRFRNL